MFDQKSDLDVNNNNNQGSQPSMPTPPPLRNPQSVGVEDIFSPISPVEETVRNNNLNPSVSNENRGMNSGLNSKKSQSGGKKIILIILIMALIAVIAGGAWYYFTYFMTATEVISNTNVLSDDDSRITNETNNNTNTNTNTNVNEETNIIIEETIDNPTIPSGIILEDDLDSDADGLLDSQEISIGSDPLNPDSDSDGLFDAEEVNIYLTNPINPDSDGDGYSDGDEIKAGYNPNGSGVLQAITR